MKRVIFRVDSSVTIGSGHVMRCLTLADALRNEDRDITFICRDLPGNMISYIENKGYKVYRLPYNTPDSAEANEEILWSGETWQNDISQTKNILTQLSQQVAIDWLIVDHYGLDMRWEQLVRPLVQHIMVIDDLANRQHDCDLLLDQNYYLDMETRYDQLVSTKCIKLIGPRYALLRPEFCEARKKARVRDGKVKRILIFFGGSDPTNETVKALQAVQLLGRKDLCIDVVVGGSNQNKEQIKNVCSTMDHTHFYCQIDNMAELMVQADLAVGAGGTTTWERAYLGLPSIVLQIADNQEKLIRDAEKAKILFNLGIASEVSVEALARVITNVLVDYKSLTHMSKASLQNFDMIGIQRMVQILTNQISLRVATQDDAMLFYKWVSDPRVRKMSFNQAEFSFESHKIWFEEAIKKEKMYVVTNGRESLGQIRISDDGEVDISIAVEFGKKGYGAKSLSLIKERPLIAHIKQENIASIKSFERAGFIFNRKIEYEGHPCLEYTKL